MKSDGGIYNMWKIFVIEHGGKIAGVNLAEYETDAISGFSLAKEIPTEEMSIYELISNYDMTLGELLELLHDPDIQPLFISVKDEETREDVIVWIRLYRIMRFNMTM